MGIDEFAPRPRGSTKRDRCKRYARPDCGRRGQDHGVEASDGGCGRRAQPAAALACALSGRREAARPPRHAPGRPASAGSRAPRSDAGLAAARFAVPPRGALGGELRIGNRSRSLHHDARRRHGLHRLAPSARLCSRASPAQVARSLLGVDHRAVTRPRRQPSARWASAAWAWTSVHAAMLARGSVKGAALGASWLGVTSLALVVALWRGLVRILRRTRALSRILARNALQGARIASAWTAAISRALAVTLRQWSAAAWTWTRLEARIFARASLKGTRQASLWTAANASTAAVALQRNVPPAPPGREQMPEPRAAPLSPQLRRATLGPRCNLWGVSLDAQSATPPAEAEHRALVVRRCTALVCVEHKRVHLPMIRAN